jgi:hypothetical protein
MKHLLWCLSGESGRRPKKKKKEKKERKGSNLEKHSAILDIHAMVLTFRSLKL